VGFDCVEQGRKAATKGRSGRAGCEGGQLKGRWVGSSRAQEGIHLPVKDGKTSKESKGTKCIQPEIDRIMTFLAGFLFLVLLGDLLVFAMMDKLKEIENSYAHHEED